MQLIQTLLLASAVAVVQGFVVPVGTPDGHYIVATDENGKATSGLIPSAVRRGAPASVRHRLAETEGLKRARHGGAALDKRGSFPEPPEKVDVSCLGPLLEPDTEHAAWQQAVDFWKGQRLISNSTSHIWISSVSSWYQQYHWRGKEANEGEPVCNTVLGLVYLQFQ
jgi:hypothetical protein